MPAPSSGTARRDALPSRSVGGSSAGGSTTVDSPARYLAGQQQSFRGGGVSSGGGGGGRAGWVPQRPSATARQSYRRSGLRASASSRGSRTRDAGDGTASLRVIDIDGVNRTPKPLVAIVQSAALRQATGLLSDDAGGTPGVGSDGDGFVQLLNSAGFSRGWFDSGAATPLGGEASMASAVGRSGTGGKALDQLPSVDARTGSLVAADSAEAAAVAADNAAYAARIAARAAAGRAAAPGEAQTAEPLQKAAEAQAGGGACCNVGCQASAWGIADAYLALEQREEEEDADPLLGGSVLPTGGALATGPPGIGGSYASSVRGSSANFAGGGAAAAAQLLVGGYAAASGVALYALGGAGGAPSSRNSLSTAHWGAGPSSVLGWGGSQVSFAAGAAAAASTAVGAPGIQPTGAPVPESGPLDGLAGLAEALATCESALSIAQRLPQMLQYRDIQATAPSTAEPGATAPPRLLAPASGASSLSASRRIPPDLVPPTPSAALRRSAAASVATTPGASTGGVGGGGGQKSVAGEGLSRLGSAASAVGDALLRGLSTGASLRSMTSSRALLRGTGRPAASLQLLWTWSCPLTEGMAVSGLAWNRANPDLLAAGYSSPDEAAPAQAPAAPDASAGPAMGGTESAARKASLEAEAQGSGAGVGGPSKAAAAVAAAQPAARRPRGLVALWSVRNAAFPRLVFETRSGVVSLDFASRDPALLAVGLRDGTVAVYDARLGSGAAPVMQSEVANGRHADPVWKVRWVDRGPERGEVLVSVSTDGRLVQWSVEKGLEHSDLMRLRRVPHSIGGGVLPQLHREAEGQGQCEAGGAAPATGAATPAEGKGRAASRLATAGLAGAQQTRRTKSPEQTQRPVQSPSPQQQQQQQQQPQQPGQQPAQHQRDSGTAAAATVAAAAAAAAAAAERDAFISRATGGMSFDFSPRDRSIYLAGTEDGWIHKCSTSYSEQYLESYRGHLAAVTALAWCPLRPDLFLSASADASLRLWQEGRPGGSLLAFQGSADEVLDAAWLPGSATAFGAVTAGGRLELWDVSASTLRPAVAHVGGPRSRLSALAFAPGGAPVVVAGSDAGGVLVFRHSNVAPEGGEGAEAQLARLDEALKANTIKAAAAGGSGGGGAATERAVPGFALAAGGLAGGGAA